VRSSSFVPPLRSPPLELLFSPMEGEVDFGAGAGYFLPIPWDFNFLEHGAGLLLRLANESEPGHPSAGAVFRFSVLCRPTYSEAPLNFVP